MGGVRPRQPRPASRNLRDRRCARQARLARRLPRMHTRYPPASARHSYACHWRRCSRALDSPACCSSPVMAANDPVPVYGLVFFFLFFACIHCKTARVGLPPFHRPMHVSDTKMNVRNDDCRHPSTSTSPGRCRCVEQRQSVSWGRYYCALWCERAAPVGCRVAGRGEGGRSSWWGVVLGRNVHYKDHTTQLLQYCFF